MKRKRNRNKQDLLNALLDRHYKKVFQPENPNLEQNTVYEFLTVTHKRGSGLFLTGKQIKQLKQDYFENPSTQEECNKSFEEFEQRVFSNRILLDNDLRLFIDSDRVMLCTPASLIKKFKITGTVKELIPEILKEEKIWKNKN